MSEAGILKKIKTYQKLSKQEIKILFEVEYEIIKTNNISIFNINGKYWGVQWPLADQILFEMEKEEEVRTVWLIKDIK